jgi:hypothetical protein
MRIVLESTRDKPDSLYRRFDMSIVTHPANDAYRTGWEETFGKKAHKYVFHNIYCEKQGPKASPREDHIRSIIVVPYKEVGVPDEHGGRRLEITDGSTVKLTGAVVGGFVLCSRCGAHLRQYEVKDLDAKTRDAAIKAENRRRIR